MTPAPHHARGGAKAATHLVPQQLNLAPDARQLRPVGHVSRQRYQVRLQLCHSNLLADDVRLPVLALAVQVTWHVQGRQAASCQQGQAGTGLLLLLFSSRACDAPQEELLFAEWAQEL
jgi:hypothetical protein